jgi:hypothetical protein
LVGITELTTTHTPRFLKFGAGTATPASFSARFSEGEWDRPLLDSLRLWPIIADEWDELVALILLKTQKPTVFKTIPAMFYSIVRIVVVLTK